MGRKVSALVATNKNTIPRGLVHRKKILMTSLLGVICLVVPLLMVFIDPIFIIALFKLRFTKGSIIHEMMKTEMEAARLEVHVFNASNGERFLRGQDKKLRLQEVGPFVYQEFRTNDELELDLDAGVVRFIPRFRAVFVEEESVGRPEETMVIAPNVPYISTSSLFTPYPSVVKSVYKFWVRQLGPTAITKIDVHKILWGYKNNIVELSKTLLPGLVYHDNIGIFDRLYDNIVNYRMEMDIAGKSKFQVKRVIKTLREKSWNASDLVETKFDFEDTYEGAAFPPKMTPETPLNIFRPGICKLLGWEYAGTRKMNFGADVFVYQMSNKTFKNTRLCDSKGLCPQGVLDLSSCFYGLPVAITKTHLLDVDPSFIDRVEGMNPDPEKDSSYLLVEPKIGLTVDTSLSLQLNLLLGDMSYMPDLAKFSDMLLPLASVKMTLPELPEATKNSLTLLYVTGPQILLGLEILSWVLGTILIAYSIKLTYHDCFRRRRNVRKNFDIKIKRNLMVKVSAELPLIK